MQGFFSPTLWSGQNPLHLAVPRCGECGLFKHCQSPKMPPSGKGKKKILIVGEAPGQDEDEQGKQFVGVSGQLLSSCLAELGIDMRRDCKLHNALACRPANNREPTKKEIKFCNPNLANLLAEFEPDLVIPLGKAAIRSVLLRSWKEDIGAVGKWVGWQIPLQKPNCWVCPNYHPSFVKRAEKYPVVRKMFMKYLERALALEGKPWTKVPDFASKVQVIYDHHEAANMIDKMTTMGKETAFDYETNMLKPDSPKARIVCCSLSNGSHTIAFPWHGQAIKSIRNFLQSSLPKIGAQIKFEQRWTQAVLGCEVKNVVWDTVLGAHVLDFRKGVTSVKFQSLVLLGQPIYNEHIEPYLKAKGSNKQNKIEQVRLDDLLCYCGLDSLLEFKLAKLQRERMGLL